MEGKGNEGRGGRKEGKRGGMHVSTTSRSPYPESKLCDQDFKECPQYLKPILNPSLTPTRM